MIVYAIMFIAVRFLLAVPRKSANVDMSYVMGRPNVLVHLFERNHLLALANLLLWRVHRAKRETK